MLESLNIAIFVGSALVLAAVLTSVISYRFGAPLLLVFLIVGLLAGVDGPLGIDFDNSGVAFFVGAIALAIILFDAGFETRTATLRAAGAPAAVLSTVGVILTALLVGLAASALFGLPFLGGFLLGAIVAPTDAAAVFFLLRVGGVTLRDRVRSTLEIESGSNDPISIFLVLVLVEWMVGGVNAEGLTSEIALRFLMQVGIGAIAGLGGGWVIAQIVNRMDLEAALYPIIVLAAALVVFAVTGMIGGSGFLAVYLAGLVAGNVGMRHAVALRRFQQGTTWMSQIAMFLTLGLLATPSQFPAVVLPAVALAAFLTFIARPVAVWLCLLPFGFSAKEVAFVSWVGLRGAVSILLAILPAIGGLEGAQDLFNIAFIVVLASLMVQGWTIGPMARYLGIVVPARHGPVERIELELPGRGDHEIVTYVVHPESPVGGGQRIPRWARPSLIVRGGRSLRPDRAGRPQPGDHVYVLTTANHIRLLDSLFAGPAEGAGNPDIYGEFALDPHASVSGLARAYAFEPQSGDEETTLGEVLRRELAGNIEQGDRIAYGPIDLIVRGVDEDQTIVEVGLALEHAQRTRSAGLVIRTRGLVIRTREVMSLRLLRRRKRGKEIPTVEDDGESGGDPTKRG